MNIGDGFYLRQYWGLMNKLLGLRMITNLHCNNNCNFCYQKDKSKTVLDLNELLTQVKPYSYKHFEYCTIMGGESTLLSNLNEYVKIGSLYSKETRLTTNGKKLTCSLVRTLKSSGLKGINVSIATCNPDEYKVIHGTTCNLDELFETMCNIEKYVDVRVNIPLCKENSENDYISLKKTLEYLVYWCGYNVTICEDILGTYSLYDQFEKIGAKEVDHTDYGLIYLELYGKRIGYYTHRNNHYNKTDLVVTPLGTWENWDGYYEAVGMNV